MSVAQNFKVSPSLHLNFDWKAALQWLTFAQKCPTQAKNSSSVITQHWCKAKFFSKLSGHFSKIKVPLLVNETEKIVTVNRLLN